MSAKELRAIRDEIKELRMLYTSLIERVIPLEEPSSDDKRVIRKKERIVKEDELIRAFD
ncbi:MAG: hypothetical protein ACRD5H_07490 [Nitrososphaerales archaeon]